MPKRQFAPNRFTHGLVGASGGLRLQIGFDLKTCLALPDGRVRQAERLQ